jgi:hypothetical protein
MQLPKKNVSKCIFHKIFRQTEKKTRKFAETTSNDNKNSFKGLKQTKLRHAKNKKRIYVWIEFDWN